MEEINCKFTFKLEFPDPSKYDELREWLNDQLCLYRVQEERFYHRHGLMHGQSFKCFVEFYDHATAVLFELTWM